MPSHYDICIVGYGPVGQTLAILLGKKRDGASVCSRNSRPPTRCHAYEWRNAAGETLLRFESKVAGLSGWPEGNMFAQPEIERLLDVRARSPSTVEVHRGHEVVGIAAADGVAALTVAVPDGRRLDVQARFVTCIASCNHFGMLSIAVTLPESRVNGITTGSASSPN